MLEPFETEEADLGGEGDIIHVYKQSAPEGRFPNLGIDPDTLQDKDPGTPLASDRAP